MRLSTPFLERPLFINLNVNKHCIMKQFLLAIAVAFTLLSCTTEKHDEPLNEWKVVYKNDGDGNPLFGKKSDLINAVRSGYPIRIGWGMRSRRDSTVTIEHVAEAKFLSIINGDEVFGQIDRIIGQRPEIKSDSIKIYFREKNQWVKMAGSNGFSTAIMYDYVNDSLVNFGQARKSTTTWFVQYSNKINQAKALFQD